MAFYYNPTDNILYDSSVYPVSSIPSGCVEIQESDYKSKLNNQNNGWIITPIGGSIGIMDVNQSAATGMLHAALVASTSVLGHVKIGASSPIGIDLNGGLIINNLSILTAMIAAKAVTTAKIDDKAVTTAKIDDGAVTYDKIASSLLPSVLYFTINSGNMSWGSGDNYFIIATCPAAAGFIFDFTLHFFAEVANSSSSDEWCADLVVKTGLSYNNAVENVRKRFWFKDKDRQSIRFTYNGVGSGNTYISVERQTVHPSNDPVSLDMNGEIYLSGLKIYI